MDDLLVFFPGALGDFLCFLPTLTALRATTRGRVTIVAQPGFFATLPPEGFERISIHRREIADLFASGDLSPETRTLFQGFSRVLSWTAHGNETFARRLASVTGGRVHLFPFRGMAPGEHAVDFYARCAGVVPQRVRITPNPEAREWAAGFWKRGGLGSGTLVVHPGSGGRSKNWEGMAALAERWRAEIREPVLLLLGPAEIERGVRTEGDAEICGEPLDRVAAILERAPLYLGNDSGISHLAALTAVPSLVLFGPTDPRTWAPRGEHVRVLRGSASCPSCGPERFCLHRLPVEEVWEALLETAAPAGRP